MFQVRSHGCGGQGIVSKADTLSPVAYFEHRKLGPSNRAHFTRNYCMNRAYAPLMSVRWHRHGGKRNLTHCHNVKVINSYFGSIRI